MKLTYEELDSRILKEAISRQQEILIEVSSSHAGALNTLVEIVTDIKAWPESKPSLIKKWITLQKAFLLAFRALLSHAQLVELLPVPLSSKVNIKRSHGPDDSLVLLIAPKRPGNLTGYP